MIKTSVTLVLFIVVSGGVTLAQGFENLRNEINQLIEDKSATVAVSIKGTDPEDTLSINGDRHMAMQSVFKLHISLFILDQIDQGKLVLEDTISVDKEMMETYSHLWSPLRKKYPEGVKVSLAEVIRKAVQISDNVACDLLFELVGGTEVVELYLHNIGINDIGIVHNELEMQKVWGRQYENWTTANASNRLLEMIYKNKNKILSSKSHQFILSTLKGTYTGRNSIRRFLPKETIIAHKTGHSGKNEDGLSAARNDIGIVFLPDGSHFYLSVFVGNSMESSEETEKIIADIAKLT